MQKSMKNVTYNGAYGKISLFDLDIPEKWNGKLIIFIHGYMGYKDWGCWNLVSHYFTDQSYGFLKYNVSHNGGTPENPIDFDDLESFGNNSYIKEVLDFHEILSLVEDMFPVLPEIYLIGHSRGGGIALLQSDNGSIRKIATWAAIATIEDRFPTGKELIAWKTNGVYFRENQRTHQQMPHFYSQYESYLKYAQRLNIESYCRNSNIPTVIIHGDKDVSVSINEGKQLAKWLETNLTVIPNEQHTFGSTQPWVKVNLPSGLEIVCRETLAFFEHSDEKAHPVGQEKLSLLSDLVKLAQSDNTLREAEFQFLLAIAGQLGVTREDFKKIFEEYIEFHPPKLELDRIVQFQRLVLLMNVDLNINEEEINYIKNIGIRMGLHPFATEEVLKCMHNYENKIVPSEKLFEIFRTFHN